MNILVTLNITDWISGTADWDTREVGGFCNKEVNSINKLPLKFASSKKASTLILSEKEIVNFSRKSDCRGIRHTDTVISPIHTFNFATLLLIHPKWRNSNAKKKLYERVSIQSSTNPLKAVSKYGLDNLITHRL